VAEADVTATEETSTHVTPTRRERSAGGPSRWWLLAALAVCFLLQLGWRLWLARSVTTPVAHADEDRYLLSARVLAGGPGGLGNDTDAFRRMGYPLLLAPIYRFTSNPWTVYHAAQAVGCVVNALAFPLGYLFGRRVLGIERRWLALGLAFVAAMLPAAVYYSEFALTDVLFAPIGLGWLLLLHGWLTARAGWSRWLTALGAGALVGYTYAIHVRGAIMLAIHLAVLFLVVVVRRSRWRVAALSAFVALVLSQVTWLTDHVVGNRLVTGGVEPQTRLSQRLLTAGGLVHTLCDAFGQIWYAGVATWGLAAVGLVVAVARIRGTDVDQVDRPQRVIIGVAFATTVLIALSSSAALPNDARVSNHAYFRYIAFLMPVWVILAGAALYRSGRRRALALVGRAAALIAAGGFVVLSRMTDVITERFQAFDTPETSFLTNAWHSLNVGNATIVGLVLLTVLALAFAAPRSRRAVPLALAGVLLLDVAAMAVVNVKLTGPMARAEYATGPQLVRDLHIGPADVVVSAHKTSLGARLNHQREVYWARVPEFEHLVADPPDDATVVVAPWHSRNKDDWDGSFLGWTKVAGDPVQEYAVWFRDTDPRLTDGSITWHGGR
jgi:hypothetical protein